ncbi:unnamed protein product [Chondrus crispus]|uniref:3'-5' exonuclease domain-containing protein n=1 Tax=Chondrus crispus TaxID=2769 RepID=R7QTP1_CHOCR|nr:unnamed protein product [Chondrus crispus]CDF41063.1 unnamed protein product [Chondrus crispus]|eukprot:XP_005711357.1 unnamed protein product [Chondrus crispus]
MPIKVREHLKLITYRDSSSAKKQPIISTHLSPEPICPVQLEGAVRDLLFTSRSLSATPSVPHCRMAGSRFDLLAPARGPPPRDAPERGPRRRRERLDTSGPRVVARRGNVSSAAPNRTEGRGNRRRKLPSTVLVSSVEECRRVVTRLSRFDRVAVDCEGVALSRKGKLCLVQVASVDGIFFFDVVDEKHGRQIFEEGGLRRLLENDRVSKVMHDCRHDSDALFHQFGVRLGPVVDTQVVFSELRKARGMEEGLPVSMRTLLKKFTGASEEDLVVKVAVRDQMSGDKELWQRRPLGEKAMQYARIDVEHLLFLEELLRGYLFDADRKAWETVREKSTEYVMVYRDDEDGPRKAQVRYDEMARMARRQRSKADKQKKMDMHQRTDPMRKFSFDAPKVVEALIAM